MRRLRALVLTLVGLLTIAGWSSAGVRPYAGPASAQVVTPDPSPPSFANQRFVIGSDNISNPAEGNPPTFATAVLPDPNAFPTFNNQMYGTIRMFQERHYPGRVVGTDLWSPDFVRYAEAFGGLGICVDDNRDIADGVRTVLSHRGISLLEVRVDRGAIAVGQELVDGNANG